MKNEFKLKLKASKKGELKRFFEQYDNKDQHISEDIEACTYVFCRPLDSIDYITAIADNDSVFEIDMFIEYGDKFKYRVDGRNCNDVVRSLYTLFYR